MDVHTREPKVDEGQLRKDAECIPGLDVASGNAL